MKDIGALIATLGIIIALWWHLDERIDREIHALDARLTSRIDALDLKIDRLRESLTDEITALNLQVGELKGQAHKH